MEDAPVRTVGVKKETTIVGIGAVVLAAIAVRVLLVPWAADDFTYFFGPWSSELRRHGAATFSREFSNYQPLYLYLLYLTNLLPIPTIWSVKVIPVVGDLVLAWITYALLALRSSGGALRSPAA